MTEVTFTWQMGAVIAMIAVAVYLYVRESYSIETISVGIIVALLIFFYFFAPPGAQGLDANTLLSGFAAPALITIMALLVVGQGLYHTGALETPIQYINGSLDIRPRQTLFAVYLFAFSISMFINNTPVVVMFIPVMNAMALKLNSSVSRFMMPLSFICILAGMTTLIGSSTNLLVNDVYLRTSGANLEFFTQFKMGIILSAIGSAYIIIFSPILLPKRPSLESELMEAGKQYIAQIRITEGHPLNGAKPRAGLYSDLKNVTVRMIQRGESTFLPPFEAELRPGDILIVATTRKALSSLLSSDKAYLKNMLDIAGFRDNQDEHPAGNTIVIGEAVIAPGSRMVGRSIEQIGIRRQTKCLVLGIQRRTRMIRKRMLDIRLEEGDVLLLFGFERDMQALRDNRDLILLDWSTSEVPDISKARYARLVFAATVLTAATGALPIEIAALSGAFGMIATGCLNIRQAVRAMDMRIFLLIGAAFAMGLALENTGAAAYMAMQTVHIFAPMGPQILIGAIFLMVAVLTNLISNSATALLFAPIALSVSEQTGIDPIVMVLTVIFAANCCFATPIAYQTNLLVMSPGRYAFKDFTRFGIPLLLLIWLSYCLILPLLYNL